MFLLYILIFIVIFILFKYLVISILITIRIIYMHHRLLFDMKLNLSGAITVLK